jgi:Cys-rich protein (TIGR01571 family)
MTTYPEPVHAQLAQTYVHQSQAPIRADTLEWIPPSSSPRMSSDHDRIDHGDGDNYLDDVHAVVVGRWKAGLLECFSDGMPTAVIAACFPCVSLAQITHRIGLYRYNSTLLCFGLLWTMALFFIAMQAQRVVTLSKHDGVLERMCDNTTTTIEDHLNVSTPCPYCPSHVQNSTFSAPVDGSRSKPSSVVLHIWVCSLWNYFILLTYVVFVVLAASIRSKVRCALHIYGHLCLDFWCMCTCCCCTLAQMAIQVDAHDKRHCHFGPKDTLPGYAVM